MNTRFGMNGYILRCTLDECTKGTYYYFIFGLIIIRQHGILQTVENNNNENHAEEMDMTLCWNDHYPD